MLEKLSKYYWLTILVLLFGTKYAFLHKIMSDKDFLQYLNRRFKNMNKRRYTLKQREERSVLIKKVNVVLNKIFPEASCLIRSLVIKEVLVSYAYFDDSLKFGLMKSDDGLLAHAWIASDCKFKLIYELK